MTMTADTWRNIAAKEGHIDAALMRLKWIKNDISAGYESSQPKTWQTDEV